MNVFYTSNATIFTSSQRLSLKEDPTQPLLDRAAGNDDIVYEPKVTTYKIFQPVWGKLDLQMTGKGFLFTSNTEFNHGVLGIQITQLMPADFALRFRYHFGPGQFIGKNINYAELESFSFQRNEEAHGEQNLISERVTTHFGAMELEREIVRDIKIRALTRYGGRIYNNNFSHRDTQFWTLGSHLVWEPSRDFEFLIGYHFERGLASGRKKMHFLDDVSYESHYVSAETKANIHEKIIFLLGFDYEFNRFITDYIKSERYNGNEQLYQGDIDIIYKWSRNINLRIGYQHGQRKFTFEDHAFSVNTFLIGANSRF